MVLRSVRGPAPGGATKRGGGGRATQSHAFDELTPAFFHNKTTNTKQRSRRKVPPRYTSTPRSLPTPSIGANAGHHRHLLTAPLRVQCTQCADGYAPSSPWGVRCDCAAGHAGANCTECADGEVAPQDRPGRRACTACPAGQVPNADSSKCVPDEPADPFLTPAVEEEGEGRRWVAHGGDAAESH